MVGVELVASMRKVEVVPHDPKWRDAFEQEKQQLLPVFNSNLIAIHHIGSTAISNIYAKPIIDFLIEVKEIAKVDECNLSMEALGYEVMGEFGISGRRYFRKSNIAGVRTHHVHIFKVGEPEVEKHLVFRDYMMNHQEDAQQYSDLKRELARNYPNDIDSYMDGKNEFIQQMIAKAVKWRES